jgi:hypothetical protein
MSLKPITVLRRARKLIADPKSWIKRAFKGTRKGVQCYCALGALATAAGVKIVDKDNLSDEAPDGLPENYYTAHKLLLDAISSLGHEAWVPGFNDDHRTKHGAVLEAFDKAIELAKV